MSEQIIRENLLVLAQAYADGHGIALTTVSKRIHGNHQFIENFLAGKASTAIDTYYGMLDRLRDDWPKGVKWPVTRDVPRPTRIGYRPMIRPAPRDAGGKFLGKKVPKRLRSR